MNCTQPDMRFSVQMVSTVVCYTICFVVALIGNMVMLLILVRHHLIKVRRVHSLLLHMTVANLLVTLLYMPKEIVHNITIAWWGGDLLCRLCKFFDVFGVALSANVLICISVDRLLSIFFPLSTIRGNFTVHMMLAIAWLVSVVTSLPQAYLFRLAVHPCASWYRQCVSGDFIRAIPKSVTFAFSVVNIMQVYIVPLIFIVACYSLILWRISNKEKSASNVNSLNLRRSDNKYGRARSRTLRMTLVVVAAFLLCWTPYAIAVFIHFARSGSSPVPAGVRKVLYAFAVFNSALSPYLYGYFSFDLRHELHDLAHCSRKTYNDRELSQAASIRARAASERRQRLLLVQNNESSVTSELPTKSGTFRSSSSRRKSLQSELL